MQWITHDGAWLRARTVRLDSIPHVGQVLRFSGPWQPYELRIGEGALGETKGRRPQRLQPLSLQFASLKTPEEYRAFAEQWGPLGIEERVLHPEEPRTPYLIAVGDEEFVDHLGNVRRFLTLGAVFKVLRAGNIVGLIEEHVGKPSGFVRARMGEWVEATEGILADLDAFQLAPEPVEPVFAWQSRVEEVRHILTRKPGESAAGQPDDVWLEVLLDNVRVRPVRTADGWTFAWAFVDLLSAIALDALLWLSKGDSVRQCIRPGCTRLFIPTHPDARYCGDVCRRAVQNARVNEARRFAWRKAEELAAKGVTGQELVRQVTAALNEQFEVKRDEATVAGWLEKRRKGGK